MSDPRERISWLHVSDLHVSKETVGSDRLRRPGGEQWAEVQAGFFEDLDHQLDATGLAPDLVLITGDLALSGTAKQYDDFDREFLSPLLAHLRGRGANALVVAVPGNHDVARPKDDEIQRYRSLLEYDKKDDEDKFVKQLRKTLWTDRKSGPIAPLFERYAAWMERSMLPGLAEQALPSGLRVEGLRASHIPGDFSVVVSRGALRLLLVGLNSAWIQFDDSDVKDKLHVPREQLFAALHEDDHEALRRFDDVSGALLLMHHPRAWLSPTSKRIFDESIYPARDNRFSACLFGHMHEARSELRAVSSTRTRCFYQSPSLFGLEHYGETQQRLDVGYTLGTIDEHEQIHLWVRRLVARGSGTRGFDFDTTLEDRAPDGSIELRPPELHPRRGSSPKPGGGSGPASSDGAEHARDVEALREWLRTHHGELELLSPGDSFPYAFDQVHIPLRLSLYEAWTDTSLDGKHLHRDLVRSDHGLVELKEIFGRAGRCCAVAVFGEPGAGKTTTLEKIAHDMITVGGETVGLPDDTLPFFVRLYRLVHDDLVQPDPLFSLASREASQTEPALAKEVLERLWKRGGLLVLLDGLDEVSDDSLRDALIAHLVATDRRDRDRRISRLLSSRFSGVTSAIRRQLDDRFLRLDVQPLDDPAIRQLATRWYQAATLVKKKPMNLEERSKLEALAGGRADKLVDSLIAKARVDLGLGALVGTPLMLTLLCAIAFVDGSIPTKHRLIYARCIEVLLRRRTVKTGEPAPMAEHEAITMLGTIAYELHSRGQRNGIDATRVAACSPEAVRAQGTEPSELLRWLHRDAGLLTKLGRDDYGFAHLTFQEYFAAHEIERWGRAFVERLAEHIGDPWWQEVILLCLSFERPEVFATFLAKVLEGDHWHLDRPVREAADPDVQARGRSPWELLRRCWNEMSSATRPLAVVRRVIERPRGTEVVEKQRARALQLLFGETDEALVELASALARDSQRTNPVRDNALRLVELAGGTPELRFELGGTVRASANASIAGEAVVGKHGGNHGFGDVWVEPRTGMRFLWVPGGTFTMGSARGERDSRDHERPAHSVTLRGYWLAETPVTNAQYGNLLEAVTEVEAPPLRRDRRYSGNDQPVVGVSWHDARRFCAWLGSDYGLPSEAQWEYAARRTHRRRYPWGNQAPDETRACFGRADKPAAVGQYPHGRGPFGHLDLAGNVWEWCADTWDEAAYGRSDLWSRVDPVVEDDGVDRRVCRGGAWGNPARKLRAAFRDHRGAEFRLGGLGFRVCRQKI